MSTNVLYFSSHIDLFMWSDGQIHYLCVLHRQVIMKAVKWYCITMDTKRLLEYDNSILRKIDITDADVDKYFLYSKARRFIYVEW